jgi:hypothetical protein
MTLSNLKGFLSTRSKNAEEITYFLMLVKHIETKFQPLLYCDEHLECLNFAIHNFKWTKHEQFAFDYVC